MAGELERARLRAADSDREAVARRLQHAVDEGRLTLLDYDERLQQAYAARTYGELDRVTADLPAPRAVAGPVMDDPEAVRRRDRAAEWRGWAGTSVLLIAIWGFTSLVAGGAIFFWPMFPVGIWGVILLTQLVEGRSKPG